MDNVRQVKPPQPTKLHNVITAQMSILGFQFGVILR
mgnify:CR=1 FL=1